MNTVVKEKLAGYREELINRLGELVAVNSEMGQAEDGAPFGKGPKEVLQKALKMLEDDGFKTVNLDNYIGYGEMGEGEKLVGIVGHLDVVPAAKEDGWDTDPFIMTEKDGVLYGRGVSDDKGAVVASMMAMKAIREAGIPLKKRFRLIMGTNEESGSLCLAHYVGKEGGLDYGFTPDGEFPLVYGEKGMISAKYVCNKSDIIDIEGGTVSNVVCKTCSVVVKKCSFSNKALEDYFNNNSLDYSIEPEGDNVRITVDGVAAHASTPELGRNAISYLMDGLRVAGFQDPFVSFYCDHFGLETNGRSTGVYCSDEYGELTLNTGVVHMKDGVIEGTIDIRFPVTYNAKQVVKQWQDHMKDENGEIIVNHTTEPLFYPVDSPLITTLMEAYQEETGDMESKPLVIGGGTYAKGISNTVAFGCAFPGNDYCIHNVNEWVKVEELMKQAEIYAAAILKFNEL